MIFTILLAFAVGATFTKAQPFVNSALERVQIQMEEGTETLFTFGISLAVLALVLGLLGVSSYPALLLLSGAVGAAYKPILARVTGGR